MTETTPPLGLAKRAGRVALGPVTNRLDMVRRDLELVQATQRDLAAGLEQAQAANARLEAYLDRFKEELWAEVGPVLDAITAYQSILAELDPATPTDAGTALRLRLEHGLLHAEAKALESREQFAHELGEVRSGTRLTQALVERALSAPTTAPADDDGAAPAVPPAPTAAAPRFAHPVPTFDLLYRAFEDRHRGGDERIAAQQEADYLALLQELPNPELPVADLGCGRGELVRLLDGAGLDAIGVDSNHGQIADGEERLFVEDDLFRWLDAQDDGTQRAVVAMHVVEHLPLDLQVRLVFEARRVLAPGGLLVLETPNALSISTAATNFWVDPTHERPVHPAFLEFLAHEAGFGSVELRPLHPLEVHFQGTDRARAGRRPRVADPRLRRHGPAGPTMSDPWPPVRAEAPGDELARLRARVQELEDENARLAGLVVRWRSVGLDGWTEPDPVPEQDDLTTLMNVVARVVLAPLRAGKRLAGRFPAVRRAAVRAQAGVQARARRR
ncbi:class I SAM-dependent methyltransferase [Aquihabitans sp. G128]|uniref:class I SAM-dependent methyltransferase n=1 Tax=Aquihabitans sp. G128 TaxID=2849779 RepID=UPI001C24970E|nr:class I SAM-dependent methyltransferase [Aquihabitans sp. G128]QXC62825.1 class I SAM-dependent methyltransferase [Aquihabitans sp. G128]